MNRSGHVVRSAILFAAVAFLAASGWAREGGGPRRYGLLQRLPSDTLFCLRISNLEKVLTQANDFLTGIAPDGLDAQAMVMAKLAALAGEDRMGQVRVRGDFVVFGARLPDGGLFVGALVPVRDYDAFVEGGETARGGIATLSIGGQAKALAAQVNRYALLCPLGEREKLVQVRRLLRQRKAPLAAMLSEKEQELERQSPIWLYANVEQASAIVRPLLLGKLAQIEAELKKASEEDGAPVVAPEGIVRFYGGLLDIMLDETASVSVGLSPSADRCDVRLAMKAVAGTEMAKAMTASPHPGKYRKGLGYLSNGAVVNIAIATDPTAMEKAYHRLIDLMPKWVGQEVLADDMGEWHEVASESYQALGDWASFSFATDSPGDGLFSMQYVFEVRDGEAMADAIEKSLRLTDSETYVKFLDALDLGVRVQVERNATTYKGVPINAAQVALDMADGDGPQSDMIKAIWGDEIAYRWAMVDGHCVYTVGNGAEANAKKLIDQIRSGDVKEVCSAMEAAIAAVPDSATADVVGTFNYVRILNATLGAIPLPDGKKMPALNVPTKGNVQFTVGSMNGGFTAWIVLQKQHVLEVKSAFDTFVREMQKMEGPKKK